MTQIPAIADMIMRAETHADDTSAQRNRAIQYYQGKMVDTPADKGRSHIVTRDLRAQAKKVLPSLMRTILGSDEVVEFEPTSEEDVEGAKQAGDYLNHVVMRECNARDAIYDALNDALILRNGVLKWWFDERKVVTVSEHTGLDEVALGELVSGDDIEVLEQDTTIETVEMEGQQVPLTLYSVKIRKTETKGEIKCAAVPRERFLIHPDAVTLDDSLVTGEKTTVTRSDLVAMGYDRELVNGLTVSGDDDDERDERRENVADTHDESQRANDAIDYYDVFVRADMDGDGIAELRHMTFAGGLTEKHLLENDEADEVQFCDICVMRQPHQWEGISLADDLMDIQRVKTTLLRQTLDNLYWQNNPQPILQDGVALDLDAVYTPEFGRPIIIRQGVDVRAGMGFNQVPFVARESYGMLDYMDKEAQERTGVSDASSGMAPDALQNMTAKASAMIEQAGIGQTELMVTTAAEGLRRFFRGLLRLSIRHQDIPRTVRLKGEFVQVDPRHWNALMDCTVNTGLGAGTRERDMQVMQFVMAMQEKIIAGFGPDNPFVKPENVSNALNKLSESAGLRDPSAYFTTPTPEEIEARMQALAEQKQQKPPEMVKLEAQMQLEQAKMQGNQAKEKAQMDADLTVKQAEIVADNEKQARKLESDAALQQSAQMFEWRKFEAEMQMRREESARNRQDAIWQAQAAAMQPEQKGAN